MLKVSTNLCPSQVLLSLPGALISGCSLDPDWGDMRRSRMVVGDISLNLTVPPPVPRVAEVLEVLHRWL